MDLLDIKILNLLNENARKSFRQIAKELKVSMSTVSNRVKKLEEQGIIKGYAPILDPQKVGLDLQVIIGVRMSKGKLIDVQNQIATYPNVFGVYDTTGDWDSIVISRFRNRGELNTFIKWVLSLENVERTRTQMVLNVVKEEVRVAPI
ncbi:MAG: AsnC family transcriptional regulator [Candidatus Proteinoplasmatales archaeon SG8-5]|nr:MAG: AsnC family transcriptional regulator [Candidatus Proteinoplasmatales archaeon SG8-5]